MLFVTIFSIFLIYLDNIVYEIKNEITNNLNAFK